MKFLFVGDIAGRAGRRAVRELMPGIIKEHNIDLVVANGENAAGGFGINKKVAEELFDYGIDILTMGNHTWKNKGIFKFIDQEPRIVRPLNFAPGVPGRGYSSFLKNGRRITVVNLIGQIYIGPHDSPFRTIRDQLDSLKRESDIIIVDFHAEATGEKGAMGYYLDGQVDCVFGTHTHVQTNDAKILPKGTAFISDLGLTGAVDSILGMKPGPIVKKHLTGLHTKFEVGTGDVQLAGAIYDHKKNDIFPIKVNDV
ncbi:MAG: TIGR00282 family metallophosphoesterase [Halanaerobiaceae bacterium]